MIIVPECGFYNEEINDPDSPYPGECEDCYRYEICLKASKEMENQKNIIYGVFGGCYSDWYIVGYFNDRELADKYCCAFGNGDYYVQPMKDLTNSEDLSVVSIGYRHRVLFDFDRNGRNWIIRHDADNYTCYLSNKKQPNCIDLGGTWIRFNINIDKNDRNRAEKIAQDYLYELLFYGDGIVTQENINMMNDKFAEPFRIAEEQRKQEELKQKELAELKRLKEKYES